MYGKGKRQGQDDQQGRKKSVVVTGVGLLHHLVPRSINLWSPQNSCSGRVRGTRLSFTALVCFLSRQIPQRLFLFFDLMVPPCPTSVPKSPREREPCTLSNNVPFYVPLTLFHSFFPPSLFSPPTTTSTTTFLAPFPSPHSNDTPPTTAFFSAPPSRLSKTPQCFDRFGPFCPS